MTPHELHVMIAAGEALTYNLPGYITQWILYGVSIAILVWAQIIFGIDRRFCTSLATFVTTIVCGMMASLLFLAGVGTVAIYLKLLLLPAQDPTRLRAITGPIDNQFFFIISAIEYWVTSLAPCFSDAIVVWRASHLYPGQGWLMILPITLILGTVATAIASDVPISSYDTWYQTVTTNSGTTATLGQASNWLSLVSNTVATALVGYKYWMYNKNIQPHLNGSQSDSSVGRTLALIVESGVLFCLVQLAMISIQTAYIHTATVTVSLYTGSFVLSLFGTAIAIIYPVLVLALVRSGNSVTNNYTSFRLPTLVGETNKAYKKPSQNSDAAQLQVQ